LECNQVHNTKAIFGLFYQTGMIDDDDGDDYDDDDDDDDDDYGAVN
jgi:hypothetical protein